jgi:uncharacterized protein
MLLQPSIQTDLLFIAKAEDEKAEENDHFLRFIHRQDGAALDKMAQDLNREISAAIDCTSCGNCCSTLMINITREEVEALADFLHEPVTDVREKYIEESLSGRCILNTIPCHFLEEKKCSIYTNRFTECREFPHLHKDGFKERLLGTLLHYGSCPIIYNVVEAVKLETGFLAAEKL